MTNWQLAFRERSDLNEVSLKFCANEKYLSASKMGTLHVDRSTVKSWERWKIKDAEKMFSVLCSLEGKYLYFSALGEVRVKTGMLSRCPREPLSLLCQSLYSSLLLHNAHTTGVPKEFNAFFVEVIDTESSHKEYDDDNHSKEVDEGETVKVDIIKIRSLDGNILKWDQTNRKLVANSSDEHQIWKRLRYTSKGTDPW